MLGRWAGPAGQCRAAAEGWNEVNLAGLAQTLVQTRVA